MPDPLQILIKMSKGCVLVAGGTGFIGSHTVIEIVQSGYSVVVADSLVNSSKECLSRVENILNQEIPFYQVDLLEKSSIQSIFKKHKINYVIHFAGLKAVGESCEKPLLYYKNNLEGTINLLEVMKENKVYNLVFSSSATVYGVPSYLPLNEEHPVGGCTNPYGKTKYFIEQMLEDISKAENEWNIVALRYFNPVGAHKSGMIGEDPEGPPNNLMPYVSQVAIGRRPHVNVFGNDYDTHDGTGVRDYIHVVDLASGHVAALSKLEQNCGHKVYNLGTGIGYSVLDMIKAMEKASGNTLKYEIKSRRPGDVASCYGCVKLAKAELGWSAKRNLDEMCEDLWRWQKQNPNGFRS